MSLGPDRVERAFRALTRAEPDGARAVEDLAEAAYPDADRLERCAVARSVRAGVFLHPGAKPGRPSR